MASVVLKHFRLLAGSSAPRVVELSGVVGESAVTIEALYAGSGANQSYLAGLVMDATRERTSNPVGSYRAAAALAADAARRDRHAVVLTDLPPLWAHLTPHDAQYRFPAWIRQELELPPAGTRWMLPRAVEREAARLARRHDYSVDFTTERSAVERFHREFYGPYLRARFGDAAVLVGETEFLAQAKQWTLARLFRRGQWVAGLLLETAHGALRFRWFGAAEEPPPPGASEVLDVACVRRAAEAGLARVHLGHSRPSLADGVVRYKSKLGARVLPIRYPQAVLGVVVNQGRERERVLDRLNARQLVAVRDGRATVIEAR